MTNIKLADSENENKKPFPFTVSHYTYKILLPKLVLAHGSSIASTYFQIAFNINSQEKAKSWQQGKCWKNPHKIAAEIGCNQRKVKDVLKVLCDVDMLELTMHGKLKMYKLKNNNIPNLKELMEFLADFDKKIISSAYYKAKELRNQLHEFNEVSGMNTINFLKDSLRRIKIPDINFMKDSFYEVEQLYKGSSLFFMNLLEINLKNHKKNNSILNTITNIKDDIKHSIILGCSTATLNRYIHYFKGYENLSNFDSKIKLLKESSSIENIKNDINKGKVIKMSGKDFYCPICDRDFTSSRALGMHLGKSKDKNHETLNKLRYEKRTSHDGFAQLVKDYAHLFDFIEESNESIEVEPLNITTEEYMNIPCDCKMSCKTCHLNWYDDFFKECNHIRKQAYMEEYGLTNTQQKERKAKQKKEVEFKDVPVAKKPVNHGPDTAPGLLKFFYDMTGGRSPNFGKEVGQIKAQMKKGLTPDEVRTTMNHMVRKGQIDLRFFSTSINDALIEQKYLKEMEQEGTAAFLLNYFYQGHSLSINLQTFVREVMKIQETMNSGLTYDETKIVLDYMISTKCTIVNFIASKRTEALAKHRAQNGGVVTGFRANPSFFDQDTINIIKDDLIGGRTHINKVEQKYKEKAIEIAKEIFKEQKFNQRYTMFEWSWRTGVQLDREMYQMAVKESGKETYIDFALRNQDKLSPEKLEMLNKLKLSFEKWLEKQHGFFNQTHITTIK